MRDQYAGDIGDYVKLALLRALAPDRQLAIAWFKTTCPDHTGDGRHTSYLTQEMEDKWRKFDPPLYDQLRRIMLDDRSIKGLEEILRETTLRFFEQPLNNMGERSVWYSHLRSWVPPSDLLFLDPDNGISTPGTASIKSVSVQEIEDLLQRARSLIVYHHQSRRRGGHLLEIQEIGASLVSAYSYKAVCALRASMWSPRVFFLVAPDEQMWNRAQVFAQAWSPHVTFHAVTEKPDRLGLTPGASSYHRVDELEARGAFDKLAPSSLDWLEKKGF